MIAPARKEKKMADVISELELYAFTEALDVLKATGEINDEITNMAKAVVDKVGKKILAELEIPIPEE